MHQYLSLCQRIIDQGVWIENDRTGKKCLTVINADLSYTVSDNKFPIITTRKSYWKAAIAELLGYLRGYGNAADFRTLGTKSWDANANQNQAWLNNPARKGTDDMGRVYGCDSFHLAPKRWTRSGAAVRRMAKSLESASGRCPASGMDGRDRHFELEIREWAEGSR